MKITQLSVVSFCIWSIQQIRVHLLFALALLPPFVAAQTLSRADVEKMHGAGIADSVVIDTINTRGVGFDLSPDAMVELKKSGISDAILDALIRASSRSASVKSIQQPADQYSEVRALYSQGKFGDVVDHLSNILHQQPNAYKARALLALALLRLNEKDLAKKEYKNLTDRGASDPDAQPYAQQVHAVLAAVDQQDQVKAKITKAIREYRGDEASKLIEQLGGNSAQKSLLHVYLETLKGHFTEAEQQLGETQGLSFNEKQQTKTRIEAARSAYAKSLESAEQHLYSEWIPTIACNKDWRGLKDSFHKSAKGVKEGLPPSYVADYIKAVRELSGVAPLDRHAMDLIFHGALLVSPYPEVERIGDRVLSANGVIRIPFYARDRFFDVVIDVRNHKIYSDRSSHPFKVRYDAKQTFSGIDLQEHTGVSRWVDELSDFDLSFAEIRVIDQKADDYYGVLHLHSYALRFDPAGEAPAYSFMSTLHCLYGEAAQKSATRSLGAFIVHVIGSTSVKATLVDPQKGSSHFWETFAKTEAAALGAVSQQAGSADGMQGAEILRSSAQQSEADQQAMEQTQRASWYAAELDQILPIADVPAIAQLEKLVGLAQ